MPRATDLGIRIGQMPSGPTNSVLDVNGVGLGHTTVHRDEPDPPDGRGVARTGVTVLMIADDAFAKRVLREFRREGFSERGHARPQKRLRRPEGPLISRLAM